MREIEIDGRMITSKNRLYEKLDNEFNFPDHFGKNLDALWDVLNESNEQMTIHVTYVSKLIEQMDGYGENILQFFQSLHQLNTNYTVYFYKMEKMEHKE